MDFLKHDVNNIPFTRAGPCSPGKDVVYEVDTPDPNPAYPGPLMSSKIQTVDLIRYILWRAQECLRYIHEGDQVEAYFFWQIMELFCRRNGKVMMCEVATTIFKAYSLLRKKMPELRMNQKDWCIDLAQLLCSYVPYDEHREGVMKMGDDLASRGMIYSAHVCYVVAKMQLGLRSWFQLIGCDSRMPFGVTVMEEAFVRTEMYEYVLSLSSGLVQPSFQVFKLCYASRLALYSCSDARKYCETIAMAAMTFPEHFKRNFLERLLWLSYKLHEEEGEEPEWQTKLWDLHNNLKFAGANLERQDLEGCATTGEIPAVLTPDEEQHTDPMDVLESRYTVGEMLGKGYFGCVCTGVRNKDGRRVAIKFVDKLNQLGKENFSSLTIPGETRQLPVEVAVMKMVSKPPRCSNVVELLDWFAMPDAIALVMEQPSPCVDLKEFIRRHNGRLSEAQARDVMWQVVQAARHCLVRGVMHCDITAENLLINIDTLQVKLIDFGSSGLLQDTPYRQFCGSNVLVPPEFLYYGVYMGVPATIWGLGIVLYNLLSGEYPFKSDEDFDSGHLNLCPDLSPECFDLMMWCLQLNPDTRPTFENILGHEWFTEGVQDKVRDFAAGPLDVPIDAAGKVKEHWTVDHAALPSYLSQKSCVGVHVLGGGC